MSRRTSRPKTVTIQNKRKQLGWRYGWTCVFCGLEIDPTLTAPDPGVATLHHVRPLLRGGRHDLSNLRLAHDRCHQDHHRPGRQEAA